MIETPRIEAACPLSRIYSIGWSVSDRTISEDDPRFVCAVVACEQLTFSSDATTQTILEKGFVIEMRPEPVPPKADDVSGVLGFLSAWGSTDDRRAHDQLERGLADIQMWALHQCLKKAHSQATGRSVILIQGPLLPKLRGRIFYRMLEAQMCSLYVVTSDPRWVSLLIKRSTCQDGSSMLASGKPTTSKSPVREWMGPLPDVSLDSPTREFIGCPSGEDEIHVVVPANTLPAGSASTFWAQCVQDLDRLFSFPEPLEAHRGAMLPSVLCHAMECARKCQQKIFDELGVPQPMTPAAQEAAAAHHNVAGESISPPVQKDLFGEPIVVPEPERRVGALLTWEWVAELFELPSDEQLSAKFRQEWQEARATLLENRGALIEALKTLSKSGLPDAARARHRWSDEMARIAARRSRSRARLPDRITQEDWVRALSAKDAL